MIITSLKVKDFGIFYGSQQLSLGPGLYVIHGRNGRGKTTLLNAIRWSLYGHYIDRQRRPVAPVVMLNRQARREGTNGFSVELRLQEGSDQFLIRRSQVLSGAGVPPSQLYIEHNGYPLTAGERERVVTQLLSERVSRFFLFDGEQLQNYELLLSQEETTSQMIKQGIEEILGLPVLDNALFDLAAVRTELNRRLARQARATQQLQQVGMRAEQAQSELDSKQADIAGLLEQQREQERIIRERDDFLQQYESSLEQMKNLEALDAKVVDLRTQRDQLREERADHLHHVWRDILAAAVEPKVRDLQQRLERSEQARAAQAAREQVQRSLLEGRCVVCGRDLDADHESHLSEELDRLPEVTEGEARPDPEAVTQLAQLSRIINTGHAEAVIRLDRSLAEIGSEELARKQEAAQLRQALQNLPENEVTHAQRERDQAQQRLGRLLVAIEEAEREKGGIEDRLRRAQDEIRRSGAGGGQQNHLSRSIDLTDDLHRVFDLAKGNFRDDLRIAVETTATEVFKQLTNEPNYSRLAINDSYGLQIIDANDQVVVGRSAGQEQVVALALIAALNRNATRRGPVMMDTPFGRLDPTHRTNILRFLSHMAEQVFLLVHGGEVTDEDLCVIRASINEHFELRRDDTDRTTIIIRSDQ